MKATRKREYEQKRIKRMKEEPKETTAQQALNELKENSKETPVVAYKVGTLVPTWVLPKNSVTKQEAVAKFRKHNNSNKLNIQIL